MKRGRTGKNCKGNVIFAKRSVHPVGVLLLQAFDDYLPWMGAADIAEILYTGSVPELARIAQWEIARSVWEATAKTAQKSQKTADKPQRENGVQKDGAVIDW